MRFCGGLLLALSAAAAAQVPSPFGIYGGAILSSTLPPASTVAANTIAFTSDQGMMIDTGTAWVVFAGSGISGALPPNTLVIGTNAQGLPVATTLNGTGNVVLDTGPTIDLTNATGAPAITLTNATGLPATALVGVVPLVNLSGTVVTPQTSNTPYAISQADNGNELWNVESSGACQYTLPQAGTGGSITAGSQITIFTINPTTCSLAPASGVTSTLNNASATLYFGQYMTVVITVDATSSPGNYTVQTFGGYTTSQAGVAGWANGQKMPYAVVNSTYNAQTSGQGWFDQLGSHTICLGTDTSHAVCADVQQNFNLYNNLVSKFLPGVTVYPTVTLSGAGCNGSGTSDNSGTALTGVAVGASATITNTGSNALYYGETVYASGGVFTGATTSPIPNNQILYVTNANSVLTGGTFQLSTTNPGVIASNTNGSAVFSATNSFTSGQSVVMTGQIPGSNFALGGVYCVSATGLSSSQFELAATCGGTPIVSNLGSGNNTSQTYVTVPGAALAPSAAPTTQPTITIVSGNYQHFGGPHSGAFVMPAGASYAGGSNVCDVSLIFNTSASSGGGFAPTGHNCNMNDETQNSNMVQIGHGSYSCLNVKQTSAVSQDWIRVTDDPY